MIWRDWDMTDKILASLMATGLGMILYAAAPAVRAKISEHRATAAAAAGDLQSADQASPMVAAPTAKSSPAPLAPLDAKAMSGLRDATASFYLAPGETLKAALTRWCADADYQLVWQSTQDYMIDAQMSFPRGTSFEDAVRQTVRAVWRQHPTLRAETYKNRVLVITSHEVQQ